MTTIKLSVIKHVTEIKIREGLRGAAYYDIIKDGKKFQIYPQPSGCGLKSAGVYHQKKWYILVEDHYYDGCFSDGGPQPSARSELMPAAELFDKIGFTIDVDA